MKESNSCGVSSNTTLPKDWSCVRLFDVCLRITDGTHNSPKSVISGFPYITVKDITNDKINFANAKKVSQYDFEKHSLNDCNPKLNDILFSKDGTVGKVSLVDFEKDFIVLSSIAIIRPKTEILNPRFLFYYFKSNTFQLQALDAKKGVAIRRIIIRDIKEFTIQFPPLPEQRKIVIKIEELFSELDKGIENLRKAKEQIKTYRQAVLAAAFSGRLSGEFRTENSELRINEDDPLLVRQMLKAAEPKAEYTADKLPEGWKWVRFFDFCKLQRGYDLVLKTIREGTYPVVTSGGINGYHDDYRAEGPCLTTGRSGGVGNITFLRTEKYWPHNTVLFVKDFCGNYPEFMYYFFLTFNFRSFSASTAVPTLDRKQLFNEMVKVPPSHEQKIIVSEIERCFSVADKLEQTIDENLKKADLLKQSILKQAFEGKLV